MSSIHKNITQLFKDNSLFQTLIQGFSDPAQKTPLDLLGYLNPIHPCCIHFVGHSEASYLNALTTKEQKLLINQLSKNQASHIVFVDKEQIPASFLQQSLISIECATHNTQSPYQQLLRAIEHIAIEERTMHGSMVIIYGQGILITGDSGSGKSSLLLALLNHDHLWVADDAPTIYRNHLGDIYAGHSGYLNEFIHSKNIGAINADETFGKSKRIPYHKLAAIIHLSDNVAIKNSAETIFSANQEVNIFGKAIPKWHIPANQADNIMVTETIAKQLNLNYWDRKASEVLIMTHNSAVSAEET